MDTTGTISTVAGVGTSGFSGDGGDATTAELQFPQNLSLDGLGNIYIADRNNNRIRRVSAGGIITTVAGTGTAGSGGDGGAASAAELSAPYDVALDSSGNLYIADSANNRIRRIDVTGIITTAAGTGANTSAGDGGAATSAMLASPSAVSIDGSGTLFISDSFDCRVHRVSSAGVITTVAGNGISGFSGDGGPATSAELASPTGLTTDNQGNLYVVDSVNQRIRRVDRNGIITTVAGTGIPGFSGDHGPATSAELSNPTDVAVDGAGNLYIAESDYRVRRVDPGGIITTIAGTGISGFSGDNGPAISAQLNVSAAVAVDGDGNLFIADTANQCIRRVDTTGVITTIAGTPTVPGSDGDGGPATSAQLGSPSGIAVDALHDLYICDPDTGSIRRVDPAGIITTVAGTGVFDFLGDGAAAIDATFSEPYDVAVDDHGAFYVADRNNEYVRRVDATGIITTVAGLIDPPNMGPVAQAQLADPRSLVLTPTFGLLAGGSSGTVQMLDATVLAVVAGRYPQDVATGSLARFRDQSFGTVSEVAYDAADGLVFVAESSANRLHVITIVDPTNVDTWTIAPLANAAGTAGFADGAAQVAEFRDPTGLYFDPAARLLYVADTGNHVIRAIDLSSGVASAMVRTVAGTPETRGDVGDNGPATSALLFAPQAITRCTNGDLFIADTGNDRVRRIAAGTGTITTVLGDGSESSSGEGHPASTFPVDVPHGLACDDIGNLFVTSTAAVRMVLADAGGIVDGSGNVRTIYGLPPRDTFPTSVTRCLAGLAVVDTATVRVTDSCTGLMVELQRQP